MTQKVALIFGISGQTGSYLAHLLLRKGYDVHGASRDKETSDFSRLKRLGCFDKVTLHSVSLFDFRSVISVLMNVRPDEVYNMAGQSSVALSFEQPVETFESIALGTINILECLRFYGQPVKFLNTVSTDCFGCFSSPANEDTPFQPLSPYAMAKAAARWAVVSYRKSYNMHGCNGILSNHESPLRPNRFVTRKIINAAVRIAGGSCETLKLGNLDVERDWGWAPDFADGIWRILQHDEPDDFILATGKTCSLKGFVSLAFGYFGLNWEDYVEIDTGLLRPSDIPRVELDTSKAAEKLNWRAQVAMPDLVEKLISAETRKILGPLPWVDEEVPDLQEGYVLR